MLSTSAAEKSARGLRAQAQGTLLFNVASFQTNVLLQKIDKELFTTVERLGWSSLLLLIFVCL